MAPPPNGETPVTEAALLTAMRHRRGLQVAFPWRRDRFAHTVQIADGRQLAPLLVSEEGDNEAWPPSPPLQQLHIEPQPGGNRVALLVGRAGDSHWSMSVEAAGETPCLIFDIACRISRTAGRLSSKYRSTAPPAHLPAQIGASFDTPAGRCRLVLPPSEGDPPLELQLTNSGLMLTPRLGEGFSSRTIRWKYRIELI